MFPIVKPPKTKLQAWLRVANPSQRERLAELAGTSEGYLYGLAGLHRKETAPPPPLRISEPSRELHEAVGGSLPIITWQDLAYAGEGEDE